MEKIKFIYLDVGDTLIHLKIPAGKIYHDILKSHNVIEDVLEESVLRKYFSNSWNQMNKKNPLDHKCRYTNHPKGNDGFWRELIGIFLSNFNKEELTEKIYLEIVNTFNDPISWTIDESFYTLYEIASRKNVGFGIISNWDLRLRNLLKNLHLFEYFKNVIISSEFGYEKPSEKIFREAMRQANLQADELIYTGDKPEFDYYPPQKLGWAPYLISTEQTNEFQTVKNLGELANIIQLK